MVAHIQSLDNVHKRSGNEANPSWHDIDMVRFSRRVFMVFDLPVRVADY